jgi:hypothetical protein
MGFGFPLRTSRLAFGPKLENTKQVRDPRRQIDGATIGNLMMWQIAASGLMVPTARMVFTVTAGVLALAQHTAAFQPDGGAAPVTARTSAGLYTFVYLASYPDEQAEAKPLVFSWGGVRCEGATFRHGQVTLNPDAVSGTIRIWDNAAAAQDCAKFSVDLG